MIRFDLKAFFLPCAPQGAPPRLHRHVGPERTESGNGGSQSSASLLPSKLSFNLSALPLRDSGCCGCVCSQVLHFQQASGNALKLKPPLRPVSLTDRCGWSGLLESCSRIVSNIIRGALFVPFPPHFPGRCVVLERGLCAAMYSDGMWAPALAASIWTSETLLSRCSSPAPKVLLPAGTRCSNSTQICVAMQALEQ